MRKRGNAGYGKSIADAVLAAEESETDRLRTGSWLDSWIEPRPARDRARRWLSMWLKSDLNGIPTDVSARYFREMADDLDALGIEQAVDRLVDKLLPRIISNGGPGERGDRE